MEKVDQIKNDYQIKMGQSAHKGTYKILELEKKVSEDKYKQRDFLENLYKKPDGKKRLQGFLLKHQDPL